MKAELEKAHKDVARAAGLLSTMLTKRTATKGQLISVLRSIDDAKLKVQILICGAREDR